MEISILYILLLDFVNRANRNMLLNIWFLLKVTFFNFPFFSFKPSKSLKNCHFKAYLYPLPYQKKNLNSILSMLWLHFYHCNQLALLYFHTSYRYFNTFLTLWISEEGLYVCIGLRMAYLMSLVWTNKAANIDYNRIGTNALSKWVTPINFLFSFW